MSEHYSDGRRYSAISKTWILLSSWNDREEIASLTEQLQVQREELARVRALYEASRSTQTAEYVNGLLQHRGQLTSALAVLELDHARLREAIEFAMTDYTSHSDDDIACLEVSDRDHQVWAKFKAALADRRTP